MKRTKSIKQAQNFLRQLYSRLNGYLTDLKENGVEGKLAFEQERNHIKGALRSLEGPVREIQEKVGHEEGQQLQNAYNRMVTPLKAEQPASIRAYYEVEKAFHNAYEEFRKKADHACDRCNKSDRHQWKELICQLEREKQDFEAKAEIHKIQLETEKAPFEKKAQKKRHKLFQQIEALEEEIQERLGESPEGPLYQANAMEQKFEKL
ncbi:hypothetical protein, partial [Xanthovirga aplysinae]|uniref:hypothetical protein n=1 Tax=Xanthovirga aplysinae TaxID=2529853 RepID=UPI0012BD51C2